MLDLGRRLGQMETASFFSNICDEVLLSSFESAKKSKTWSVLKNEENQIFESFDEFCRQRCGYSYARLQRYHRRMEGWFFYDGRKFESKRSKLLPLEFYGLRKFTQAFDFFIFS